jgi:hypothetical protein
MNRFRSRLNVGCSLLFVAGFALSLAFEPIDSAIGWLTGESAGLKMTRAALSIIEASAVIILGPLVLGALAYVLSNGLGRTCAQILSFWLAGFKSGLVCLLLFLPLSFIHILNHAGRDVVTAGLYTALVLLLCVIAPFWCLLLIRHLPTAVLRGTLFERAKEFGDTFGATDL